MTEVTSEQNEDSQQKVGPEEKKSLRKKRDKKLDTEPSEVKAETETKQQELEKEEKKAPEEEDFKSKYLYLAAEMENMKRRFERERENFLKYGNEKILSALIEVVDNFDRSIEALNDDKDEKIVNIRVGIEMVRTQFLDVLKHHGLEAVQALGQEFDPNFHEAIGQQPTEGKKDQEVVQEYQKGYLLNGRLLRAAKVIVAKND